MKSSDDRLRNLAEKAGSLLAEPASAEELARLLSGAEERLRDARFPALSASGRFTLAYEASHGFALAALRARGYRPSQAKGHRKVVFDVLDATAGAPPVLAAALGRYHDRRNRITYDGMFAATTAEAEDLLGLVMALGELVEKALQRK